MESKLTGVMSDGFVEAMWETLITLATAVAICISVISLSAHLNETRAIRGADIQSSAVRHPCCRCALAVGWRGDGCSGERAFQLKEPEG